MTAPASLPSISPVDGSTLEAVEATSLGEITEVVANAQRAQKLWEKKPVAERVEALLVMKKRALAQAESLASVIRNETAKPLAEALLSEVIAIADLVDYWTSVIELLLEPREADLDPILFAGKRGRTHRVPRGVIALITPWNYPLAIPMRQLVPALLAGNAVVLKPSEHTPRTGAMLLSLFEGSVPKGLVGLVQGGADVAEKLLGEKVDAVSFTGSVEAGRRVATICAGNLIPCSLELGGNDAAIVLADARVDRAAHGVVWGAFTNAGQNCASIERVYVERSVAEVFIRRVVELTAKLRSDSDVGNMTTHQGWVSAREKLAQAIDSGAEILEGGLPEEGSRYFAPTVLRISNEDIELLREETFAPVLPIVVVDNAEDAIARTNQSRFGLTASLWTKNISRAQELARRLEAGVVTINNHAFTAALPMAPWTGVKASGQGVTNSPLALDHYTRPFFVLTDKSKSVEPWWFPYDQTLRNIALRMAQFRGGAGFFRRAGALGSFLVLFLRRVLRR